MASIIQGSANANLQLVAGAGQSIVFTTDADGSIDIASMATEGYVDAQVGNLIDSAPAALDTLNELAAALGDDSDFAGTVTTSLAGKADAATDIAGYGITDAYTITEVDTALGLKANAADVYTQAEVDALTFDFDTKISNKPTTLAGYGITDAHTQAEIAAAYQVKFVTAPSSSIGQAGDLAGQIAISATHIYYCTADYTDGLSDIWARTALVLETW